MVLSRSHMSRVAELAFPIEIDRGVRLLAASSRDAQSPYSRVAQESRLRIGIGLVRVITGTG